MSSLNKISKPESPNLNPSYSSILPQTHNPEERPSRATPEPLNTNSDHFVRANHPERTFPNAS